MSHTEGGHVVVGSHILHVLLLDVEETVCGVRLALLFLLRYLALKLFIFDLIYDSEERFIELVVPLLLNFLPEVVFLVQHEGEIFVRILIFCRDLSLFLKLFLLVEDVDLLLDQLFIKGWCSLLERSLHLG